MSNWGLKFIKFWDIIGKTYSIEYADSGILIQNHGEMAVKWL